MFVCGSVLEKIDMVWFELRVQQGLYLTGIVQT
jgi:hypothetical protein